MIDGLLDITETPRLVMPRETHRLHGDLFEPVVLDYFAGGGGASLGMEWALGRAVDLAVNHDPAALECHHHNHPLTEHRVSDVFEVDIRQALRGRPVLCWWFSPDCRHFSIAKGASLLDRKIRGLAWVVVKAIGSLPAWQRPPVFFLENVREFLTWGPLDGRGRPDPAKKGMTFNQFVGRLRGLGYNLGWRVLDAADYGEPTHRRRLVLIGVRGDVPCWPEKTHGKCRRDTEAVAGAVPSRGSKSVRGAKGSDDPGTARGVEARRALQNGRGGERVGVRIPPRQGEGQEHHEREDLRRHGGAHHRRALVPYRTAAECIDWSIPCPSIFDRKRPLADKTLRRIALGIWRYVINNPKPFIVQVNHGNDEFRGQAVDEPLRTVSGKHGYGLVTPTIVNIERSYKDEAGQAVDVPLGTVTASPKGGKHALVSAHLVSGYGEREGQDPRSRSVEDPAPTVVGSSKHAMVAALLTKHYGGVVGHEIDRPAGSITSRDSQSVTTATLIGVGGRAGQSPERPVDRPYSTVTSKADGAVAAASLIRMNFGEKQWNGVDEPLLTITSQGNKAGLVYAFLVKYFSSGGQWAKADEPLATITAKHRMGVVTVTVEGVEYVIADIGLRMLSPRELARCQGFPDDYWLPKVKSRAVKLIGNSVPPGLVRAVVAANRPHLDRYMTAFGKRKSKSRRKVVAA